MVCTFIFPAAVSWLCGNISLRYGDSSAVHRFLAPLYATGVEALSEVVWTDAVGKNNLAGYADSGPCFAGINRYFSVFRQPEPWVESLLQPSTFTQILLVITICVFAPISEEIIFRGFLLNAGIGFGRRGRLLAVVITSLLFALVHTQYLYPATFVSLFVFSAILCEVRIRTGSLLMPMVLHSANNIASVAWVLTLS